MALKMTPVQAMKLKKIMDDPVLWCHAFLQIYDTNLKKMVKFKPREYQEDMLRCNDLRQVFRCGRRLGKTTVMEAKALHAAFTHKSFVVLFITPYDNQVSKAFQDMNDMIDNSPMLKKEVRRRKNNPYLIELANGSRIKGFTTGASSGTNAASTRGQRGDLLILDEVDYMADGDYATISMIANERADIGIIASSTPTGKRGTFYNMCTNPEMGFTEFFHPSQDNPQYTKAMDDANRAELTALQYEHEVLAEFGTEEAGVFPKDKVDAAKTKMNYTYDRLTDAQVRKLSDDHVPYPMEFIYNHEMDRAPQNIFRCVGVDFDKFQSSSSIIVLDYDVKQKKFWVMKRIEVPRGEYTLDNAVNWIIKVNRIYNPAWIFIDRGYGDYQLERLHIYGDEHPGTGLKTKVIGWQFANKLDVMDPVTKEMTKEPLKQFMVSQLCLAFERDQIILSPYDDVLHKQLVDYEVDHMTQSGQPVYTSKNEHFVDALGLAYLAFVLKFPTLAKAIKEVEHTTIIEFTNTQLGANRANAALREISAPYSNPWGNAPRQIGKAPGERRGDYQKWVKIPVNAPSRSSGSTWGSRTGSGYYGRSLW